MNRIALENWSLSFSKIRQIWQLHRRQHSKRCSNVSLIIRTLLARTNNQRTTPMDSRRARKRKEWLAKAWPVLQGLKGRREKVILPKNIALAESDARKLMYFTRALINEAVR